MSSGTRFRGAFNQVATPDRAQLRLILALPNARLAVRAVELYPPARPVSS
jgi:hypothetical protein